MSQISAEAFTTGEVTGIRYQSGLLQWLIVGGYKFIVPTTMRIDTVGLYDHVRIEFYYSGGSRIITLLRKERKNRDG